MTEAAPCIFCAIVEGKAPAAVVYRDDLCTAFMDIQPITPGHAVIVPNRHAARIVDVDTATAGHMMQVAQRLVAALRRSDLRCEGVNLWLGDGDPPIQQVPHAHLHVFPRHRGDGLQVRFSPDYQRRPRQELEDAARRLQAALEAPQREA